MGRRVALALALSTAAAAQTIAQEVVVFSDYRSLVVKSHREAGQWTYLRLESGEMAVDSGRILEIRKEDASPQSQASPPAPVAPQQAWQPEKPSPPAPPKEEPAKAEEPPEPEEKQPTKESRPAPPGVPIQGGPRAAPARAQPGGPAGQVR